jgi:sn1-specific diacylglycerol lipase
MMVAAVRCRLPKLQILTGWLGGTAAMNDPNESLLWKEDEIPEEVQTVLDNAAASVEGNVHRKYLLETSGTFGLPGRVFHLQLVAKHSRAEIKKSAALAKKVKKSPKIPPPTPPPLPERAYQAVWIDSEELAKEGLQMSGRVISDHMPDFIAGVLRQVARVGRKDQEEDGEERVRVGTRVMPTVTEEEEDVEDGM